jgi:hypothetical protein
MFMDEKELPTENLFEEEIEDEETEEVFEEEPVNKSFTFDRAEKFLSTFAAICLSVMSIIISVISVGNEKDSKIIAAMELDILQNDREAYFVVENSNDATTDEDFGETYTITNKGGRVSGFRIKPYVKLGIYMSDYGLAEKDEKTGKMTQGYFFDKLYTITLKNTAFTKNGVHDNYDYGAYNDKTRGFAIQYKLNKAFYGKLKELENNQIKVNGNTEFSYYTDTGVLIKYSNYKNEVKQQEYSVTSNAISVGSGVTMEDVEEEEVYYTISEYSAEEAEKLVDYIKTRFELDLKIYKNNLKNEK